MSAPPQPPPNQTYYARPVQQPQPGYYAQPVQPVQAGMMCPGCGRQIPSSCNVCPFCGKALNMQFQHKDKSSRTLIIILCVVVALIIVLPAILYAIFFLWVGGTVGPLHTPSGSITGFTNIDAKTERIFFNTFSPSTNWAYCTLKIENMSYPMTYQFSLASGAGTIYCSPTTSNADFTVSGSDITNDAKVTNGDYLDMVMNAPGFLSGSTYKIQIFYLTTGQEICEKSFSR